MFFWYGKNSKLKDIVLFYKIINKKNRTHIYRTKKEYKWNIYFLNKGSYTNTRKYFFLNLGDTPQIQEINSNSLFIWRYIYVYL